MQVFVSTIIQQRITDFDITSNRSANTLLHKDFLTTINDAIWYHEGKFERTMPGGYVKLYPRRTRKTQQLCLPVYH